jgi:hypothetical protein
VVAIILAQAHAVPLPVAFPEQQSPIFSGLSAIGKHRKAGDESKLSLE